MPVVPRFWFAGEIVNLLSSSVGAEPGPGIFWYARGELTAPIPHFRSLTHNRHIMQPLSSLSVPSKWAQSRDQGCEYRCYARTVASESYARYCKI